MKTEGDNFKMVAFHSLQFQVKRYSLELTWSWDAISCSNTQEIASNVWNIKVHYCAVYSYFQYRQWSLGWDSTTFAQKVSKLI
jgi:hypothetical protein